MPELREIIYKAPPMTNCYTAARLWLARPEGFGLLPAQVGSKKFIKGFGPFIGCVETPEDARYWFYGRPVNLAVLAPETVVILDFDDIKLYDLFVAGWPALAGSYTEASPGGGRHIFLSVEEPGELVVPGMTKGLEVKKYCLVAPSQLGGVRYEVLQPGPILRSPRGTIQAALEPFAVAPRDKYQPFPAAGRPGACKGSHGHKTTSPASQGVIERAKARWPVLSYLAYFGVDCKLAGQGRWRRGKCCFHADEHPSFWVDTLLNSWGCFSENLRGDVVSLHARRCNLSMVDAARDLLRYDIRFSG